MMRTKIWRWMRLAVLAATASLALGTVARAQYYDRDDRYYRNGEAREHGCHNGYQDGLHAGQYDMSRGRRFNFRNDDWEDSRGYEHWMGSKGDYKRAYREGYEEGYRRGYDSYGYRRGDRDDYRRRDRDDWR
jgi:hypothetical protein